MTHAQTFLNLQDHDPGSLLPGVLAQAIPGGGLLTQPALLYAGLAAVAIPILIHLLFRIRR
ncbi:MAG: hypothetical protein AAGA57_07125, partial [Planctomycetota bacterium]